MKSKLIYVALCVFIFACNPKQDKTKNSSDKLLTAVLWYQHSAEMTALYYQGFNIAKMRLNEAIANNQQEKPLAVVVDIDETMLNNSPYETSLLKNPDSLQEWYQWTAKSSAKALPGALEFAKYAESKNVKIFYITNRDDKERAATLKNLVNVGFPYADEDHLLTRSDLSYSTGNTSSKEGRRIKVSQKNNIVLLLGDNLNDFSQYFEDRSKNDGKDSVAKYKELFGQKFIVLPNPIYGAWEKPLYNYNDTLSDEAKTRLMKSKLIAE